MSELQRLRERIEALEERVQELEYFAGMGEDDVTLIKLATGMPPAECKILGAIRKRRGVIARQAVYSLVYGGRPECDQPEPKILDVLVSRMRKAMRTHGIEIETVRETGYRMSDDHRAKLTAMMEAYLIPAAA